LSTFSCGLSVNVLQGFLSFPVLDGQTYPLILREKETIYRISLHIYLTLLIGYPVDQHIQLLLRPGSYCVTGFSFIAYFIVLAGHSVGQHVHLLLLLTFFLVLVGHHVRKYVHILLRALGKPVSGFPYLHLTFLLSYLLSTLVVHALGQPFLVATHETHFNVSLLSYP
jgi:hypothetical protein